MNTLRILSIVALVIAAPLSAQNTPPAPPCSTPEYRQMDFWVGEWDLEFTNPNGTTGKASNTITKDERRWLLDRPLGTPVYTAKVEDAGVLYIFRRKPARTGARMGT